MSLGVNEYELFIKMIHYESGEMWWLMLGVFCQKLVLIRDFLRTVKVRFLGYQLSQVVMLSVMFYLKNITKIF